MPVFVITGPNSGLCFFGLFLDTHLRSFWSASWPLFGLYMVVLHILDGGFAAFAWHIDLGIWDWNGLN